MGSKVTFDYSKADVFISAHEMESMKKITEAAKACLLYTSDHHGLHWQTAESEDLVCAGREARR